VTVSKAQKGCLVICNFSKTAVRIHILFALLCSDEREARGDLGEEVEKVEHERARACALANEAQALRNKLLACRQKLEAKENVEVGPFQKLCGCDRVGGRINSSCFLRSSQIRF
jgi:hypothetical protein